MVRPDFSSKGYPTKLKTIFELVLEFDYPEWPMGLMHMEESNFCFNFACEWSDDGVAYTIPMTEFRFAQ